MNYNDFPCLDDDEMYWFHELSAPFFVTTNQVEGGSEIHSGMQASDLTVRNRSTELQNKAKLEMAASLKDRYLRGALSVANSAQNSRKTTASTSFEIAPWTMVSPDDVCQNDRFHQDENKINRTETFTSNEWSPTFNTKLQPVTPTYEDDSHNHGSSQKPDKQNNSTTKSVKVVNAKNLRSIVNAGEKFVFLAPGGSVTDNTSSTVPTAASKAQPGVIEIIPATLPDGRVINLQVIRETMASSVPPMNEPKKEGLKRVILPKKREKPRLGLAAPGQTHYLQKPTGIPLPASNSRVGKYPGEVKRLATGGRSTVNEQTSEINWYIPDLSNSSSADELRQPVSHFLCPEHTTSLLNELSDQFPSEEHEDIESLHYGDILNGISKGADAKSSDVKRSPLSPVDTNAHLGTSSSANPSLPKPKRK